MKKLVLVGVVMSALVLGACGSGTKDSAFCNQYVASSNKITTLNLQDPASVQSAIDELKKLEGTAPAEIKDDISTLVTNLEAAQAGNFTQSNAAAVQTAGTNLDDFAVDDCNIKIKGR